MVSDIDNGLPSPPSGEGAAGDPSKPAPYTGYEAWKMWDADSFGTYTAQDAAYFSAELAQAGVGLARGLRVVELGFGNGSFAGWARAQGLSYTGTEVNEELLSRAARTGFDVVSEGRALGESLPPATVDLVVAWDVLEHLYISAIEGLLSDVRGILKPKGCLLARVPSGDSPFGRAVFHGDLTHRTALGSSAVRQLAARQGWEVVAIVAPRLPWRGLGFRRGLQRLAVLAARSVVARFVDAVFHGHARRVITENMVFVLRKPSEG